VNSVEAFCLLAGELHHTSSDDSQTGVFETADDFADHIFSDSIGFDNRQGAFYGHKYSPGESFELKGKNDRKSRMQEFTALRGNNP
jgi:hypothetical protein